VTIVDVPGTFPLAPASLHADARGELYLTVSAEQGSPTTSIYHLEAGP